MPFMPCHCVFRLGLKWEYSNIGYVALAEIIHRVTQQPWTEFLSQRIFVPAGMTVTLPTNTTASVPNRALGYTGRNNERKGTTTGWRFAPAVRISRPSWTLAKWEAQLCADKMLSDRHEARDVDQGSTVRWVLRSLWFGLAR